MKNYIVFAPRRISKKARNIFFIILIIAALIFSVLYFDFLIRPNVMQMAKAEAVNAATLSIYDTVASIISGSDIKYSDLIKINRDLNGSIQSIVADMAGVNLLKSEITRKISEKSAEFKTESFSIPLGNLLGSDFLVGRGPRIPFKVIPVSVVYSDFESSFYSSGINQTIHKIDFTVSVNISIIMSGFSSEETVTTLIPVTQTVIVGKVPEQYFNISQ